MFNDIANAIGQALGADATVGGYVAGATFTIVLIIVLEWSIGNEERAGNIFFMSIGLGITLSSLFGWFPLWIPFLMGMIIILLLINPFSDKSGSGG